MEEYFAIYEFVAKYLLCCSDAESYTMSELLELADAPTRRMWEQLGLGYTECKGMPELREVCAQVNYSSGGLKGENILFFAGAEEGIYCTFQTLLQPDDHAIVITPCYQSLKSIPDTLCAVSIVDLDLSEEFSLDVDAVRAQVQPGKTKLIVMNFPHNPTGTLITLQQQQQLVALAREFDLWLFCDEVYRGVERDPGQALPPMAAVYEKGFSLGALSKVYGMAGLRIGWLACSDVKMIDAISANKHYLSICNSGPSEVLALIALKAKDTIIARTRDILLRNEQLLTAFLARHPHLFHWTPPKGGCCGFLQMHLPSDAHGKPVSLASLAEVLAKEHGVLILPGEQFPIAAAQAQAVRRFFRIGLGRKNFAEALLAFEAALPQALRSLGVAVEEP